MKHDDILEIHESLLNGQRRQMVSLIEEYGLYDFFEDYKEFLKDIYQKYDAMFSYFSDATISYFRIKDR